MKKEHSGKNVCDKCNRSIDGKFSLYAHHYDHLTNGNQVSELDDQVLRQNQRTLLNDNINSDESAATFSCKIYNHSPVALRKSAERHILQSHIYYAKHKIKRFSCEYCGL